VLDKKPFLPLRCDELGVFRQVTELSHRLAWATAK